MTFSQLNKKVGKLLEKLLIISICNCLPFISFSQKETHIDTAGLRKDIDSVLKKHGLRSNEYSIKVVSINQKGGQTALVINNNYLGDTIQRHLTEADLKDVLERVRKENKENPNLDSSRISICSMPDPEAIRFGIELKKKLLKMGYKVITHSNQVGAKELEGNFDIYPGWEGCVIVGIQPIKNKDF